VLRARHGPQSRGRRRYRNQDRQPQLDSTIHNTQWVTGHFHLIFLGKNGRAMIRALIAGETDPIKLAALADGRIKASPTVPGKATLLRLGYF
jgi:hypothetical protein